MVENYREYTNCFVQTPTITRFLLHDEQTNTRIKSNRTGAELSDPNKPYYYCFSWQINPMKNNNARKKALTAKRLPVKQNQLWPVFFELDQVTLSNSCILCAIQTVSRTWKFPIGKYVIFFADCCQQVAIDREKNWRQLQRNDCKYKINIR